MNASRTSAAVIGATGYAGATAVQLLLRHPQVEITRVTSRSNPGRPMAGVYPGIESDLVLHGEADPGDAEVVVVALPHGTAASLVPGWLREGRTVLDLGADFRLKDPAEYARWYGADHPAPELLGEAVFGLPEVIDRGALPGARLVACPGCYSTAAILALTPAVRGGLGKPDYVVDAASGVSGAGRSLGLNLHFAEAAENFNAYSVEGHRHLAEMTQEIHPAAGDPAPRITFVPHLVPMVRGILVTCYYDLAGGATIDQLRDGYRSAYADCPFIRVVDTPPGTKQVAGTNECHIHVTQQGDRVVVLAAIDNLVKGAAGQAVQALNIARGWPETAGLELPVRWP
ncbi:MAG: N-acetyl-gamma-glutamyl-phosphate reductase [Candidatus Dormibacteraeota bacterium]|nr:N-acetyl-gamma-glutamyl-phosphate reductase [Candidatus Dormibacteraeota bacterium]